MMCFLSVRFYSIKLGSNVLCDTTRSVPLLPLPEYDTYGNPEWFPRIVGGYPAALGDFKGIVRKL